MFRMFNLGFALLQLIAVPVLIISAMVAMWRGDWDQAAVAWIIAFYARWDAARTLDQDKP